jgi:hypothetical protein
MLYWHHTLIQKASPHRTVNHSIHYVAAMFRKNMHNEGKDVFEAFLEEITRLYPI